MYVAFKVNGAAEKRCVCAGGRGCEVGTGGGPHQRRGLVANAPLLQDGGERHFVAVGQRSVQRFAVGVAVGGLDRSSCRSERGFRMRISWKG